MQTQATNELKTTEEELSRVRASLSEATAAVIKLTDELASSNLTSTANNSTSLDSLESSDTPPKKRERKSNELSDSERKSSEEGASAGRSGTIEPAGPHIVSFSFFKHNSLVYLCCEFSL